MYTNPTSDEFEIINRAATHMPTNTTLIWNANSTDATTIPGQVDKVLPNGTMYSLQAILNLAGKLLSDRAT